MATLAEVEIARGASWMKENWDPNRTQRVDDYIRMLFSLSDMIELRSLEYKYRANLHRFIYDKQSNDIYIERLPIERVSWGKTKIDHLSIARKLKLVNPRGGYIMIFFDKDEVHWVPIPSDTLGSLQLSEAEKANYADRGFIPVMLVPQREFENIFQQRNLLYTDQAEKQV